MLASENQRSPGCAVTRGMILPLYSARVFGLRLGYDDTGAREDAGAYGGGAMRDLTTVGLSDDRRHVILRSASGEECRVPVDDRLRATLRNDRARLGQLEIEMDSALRPREIQARIRRGETPEQVAETADVSLERIMGYA